MSWPALAELSPALQAEVRPLLDRWPGFVDKLRARVDEVVAEADAGLDALIAAHAIDAGPMGAAFAALQTRFHGLRQRLDEAATKIEELLWEILFRDGVGGRDGDVVSALHDEIGGQRRELDLALELRYEALHTATNARWARRLYELARAEVGTAVRCARCGAGLAVRVLWQASNETCAHCGAVNGVTPGAATYAYFGQGVHALAHEAAFEAWRAEQHHRRAYERLRHPTAPDRQRYLAAVAAYWTAYYERHRALHPGFASSFGTVEAAARAKLAHHVARDTGRDRRELEFLGAVLAAASRGDARALHELARACPEGTDLADGAAAAMERGDAASARVILDVLYDLEGESGPRQRWLDERLRELRRGAASR
jgi:hypothetical protein